MRKLRRRTGRLKRAYGFARKVCDKFAADGGGMLAGAMSFYALLSLAPMLLLAVGIFPYLLGSPERVYAWMLHYIDKFSPALAREQAAGIRVLIDQLAKGKHVAWGVGGLALAWAAMQIFVSLEFAMRVIWKAKAGRGYIRTRLLAFAMMLSAGALFLIAVGISTAAHLVRNAKLPIPGFRPGGVPLAWDVMGACLPVLLVFLMFLLVYRIVPHARVPLRSAAVGALTSAVLWEAARWLFGWYTNNLAHFSRVYGAITTVIVLALWIYYCSMVTVLGAEVGAVHRDEAQR